MRKVPRLLTLLCLVTMVPLLSGCEKISARSELKRGNQFYKQEQYNDALQSFQKGLEMDPEATFAWRSLGLTSMALFRPGNKTPENIAHAERAIDAFKKYLIDYPDSPKVLEFLINLYITIERYEDGIAYLQEFVTKNPENNSIHMTMVTLMTKANKVTEALDWANTHPAAAADPVVYYTIGVNAWDKSYNDVNLNKEARTVIVDTGLAAMNSALTLKKDFQTLVYTNLLYREKAKLYMPDPLAPTPNPKKKPTPEEVAAETERQAKYDEYVGLANKYAVEAAEFKKEEDRLKAEAEKVQGIGDGKLPPQKDIPGTEPTYAPNPSVVATPPPSGTPGASETPGAEAADPNTAKTGQNP